LETLGPTTTASAALKRLGDLKATFARGTFTELLAATRNVERAPVIVQPFDESLEATNVGTEDVRDVTVTLGDVLSRVPDLAATYARTFVERGRCYPARVTYMKPAQETRIDILPTAFLGLPDERELREAFLLPPWISVEAAPLQSVLNPGQVAISFTIPHPNEIDLEAIPWVVGTRDGRTFVLAQKPDDARLSLLLTLYLVAFFTGTLARYHPSVWLTLQAPGAGDYFGPILREAVATVQSRYPELIMREIRNTAPGSLIGH